MDTSRCTTKNEVVGRLRIEGMSMKDFAVKEGYEPDTVRKVVNRYVGSGKRPQGTLAREILKKLLGRVRS